MSKLQISNNLKESVSKTGYTARISLHTTEELACKAGSKYTRQTGVKTYIEEVGCFHGVFIKSEA